MLQQEGNASTYSISADPNHNRKKMEVSIRSIHESSAMDSFSRWKLKFWNSKKNNNISNQHQHDASHGVNDQENNCRRNDVKPQYHIHNNGNLNHTYYNNNSPVLRELFRPVLFILRSLYGDGFITWSMSATYIKYLGVVIMHFLSQIFFFSILVMSITDAFPECISSGRLHMSDSFVLSWTTYSTVGYGHISPSISPQVCNSLNVLMVLEAMIGILYAGFAAAVLFAKVWAAQGLANVSFSSVLLIRYGLGVDPHEIINNNDNAYADDNDLRESVAQLAAKAFDPLPVLEFRIVNNVDISSCVLLNAEVNCVVGVESLTERSRRMQLIEEINKELQSSNSVSETEPKLVKLKSKRSVDSNTNSMDDPPQSDFNSLSSSRRGLNRGNSLRRFMNSNSEANRKARSILVDDLATGRSIDSLLLGNDNKFLEVKLECPVIPIFQRVWNVQHVLDENSPLLRKSVREKIRTRHRWPEEYNSAEGIRRALNRFGQMHIIFQTVTHSGIIAYKHKTYDFHDVIIGYRFADISYLNAKIKGVDIDRALLNDIVEQNSGGGEPLMVNSKPTCKENHLQSVDENNIESSDTEFLPRRVSTNELRRKTPNQRENLD